MAEPPGVDDAKTAFLGAVAAADPTRLVKAHVRTGAIDDWLVDRDRPRMIDVIALGKAAPRMAWGLVEASVPFRGIGITTKGQTKPNIDTIAWHVGDHPIPGDASFAAGDTLLAWVDALPEGRPVLVLLSGGSSACVEAAEDPEEAARVVREGIAGGLAVEALNRGRAAGSRIKGGRLGERLRERGHDVRVWLLCDVDPRQARSVGSGPFDRPDIPHHILADAARAAEGAGHALMDLGYEVFTTGRRIDGPMEEAVRSFVNVPLRPGQALVAAGEPTLPVPPGSPPGGRCQHAAALAGLQLAAGEVFFAGATDGVDGSTKEAGAWAVTDAREGAAAAVHALDTHAYLTRRGQTLRLGPTGTNLNDVWIRLRPAMA